MSFNEFMHSTYGELSMVFEAYNEMQKNKQKLLIYQNYALSTQIATFVGCILSGKQLPTIDELYPELNGKINKDEIAYLKFKELADAVNSRKGVIKD